MDSNFYKHQNLIDPRREIDFDAPVVAAWALTFISVILLCCGKGKMPTFSKFMWNLAAGGMAGIAGIVAYKSRPLERYRPAMERMEQEAIAVDAAQQVYAPIPAPQPSYSEPQSQSIVDELTVDYLDPVALKKQNTGLLVCGSSGSAKTTLVRFCLPYWMAEGYQIIVLDPHADPDNPEYPWADFPYVVGNHDDIFKQIKILLDLLQSKDKQKIICICDEWTDLLGYAQLQSKEMEKMLRNFLVRWGTGGRKFNKFLVGIGHTDNVKMWGLDKIGGLLRNFGILRLGDIAVRYGETKGNDSPILCYCQQVAYPLIIGDRPTIHPTHGHYQVKENEQPPINLQPLKFHKLGFEFVGERQEKVGAYRDTGIVLKKPDLSYIQRCFNQEFDFFNSTSGATPPAPSHQLHHPQSKDYSDTPPTPPVGKIDPFIPLSPENKLLVERLLSCGMSQNRLALEIFAVTSKNTKPYHAAVELIKQVKNEF